MNDRDHTINIALTWCLAWGEKRSPQHDLTCLHQMRQAIKEGTEIPQETKALFEQVEQLQDLDSCQSKTLSEI